MNLLPFRVPHEEESFDNAEHFDSLITFSQIWIPFAFWFCDWIARGLLKTGKQIDMIGLAKGEVPTKVQMDTLAPVLKKILSKSKASHSLRFESGSNEIKLKTEKQALGTICLEAPYIALPNFDLLKLIRLGKCCSYCGEVLKIYDTGKLKDDGNKQTREKQTTMEKQERYLNGLDCSNCEVRWCDKQCKDLDFKHELLTHRPANKSVSHPFVDCCGNEKDTFYFDKWVKLEKLLVGENMDVYYQVFMCLLHIYHDPTLKEGYESLKCVDFEDEFELEEYLGANVKGMYILKDLWSMFLECFKTFQMSYRDFLKYSIIYYMNNYSGSVYLIFSAITKSNTKPANIRVEYFTGNIQRDYEEFSVETKEDNSVRLVKHRVTDSTVIKPIYTNKTSGVLNKKIIQILSTEKVSTDCELVLKDEDYSNPLDIDDDEIGILSDDSTGVDLPKIILPVSTSKERRPSKIRAASFTSSGASFGEGIIKYNRDQIREMLENMSLTLKVDEESSDELDEVIVDEVPSTADSSVNKNIVNMMINLQVAPHSTQRRKSVKFAE